MKRHPALVLALALLLFSILIIGYRILRLDYPVFPAAPGRAWQVTMDGYVQLASEASTVRIGLPSSFRERIVVEERIQSGELPFNLVRQGPNQIGIWSVPRGPGEAVIRYEATVLIRPKRDIKPKPSMEAPSKSDLREDEKRLVEKWARNWLDLPLPARFHAIASLARGNWTPLPQDQDRQGWSEIEKRLGRPKAFQALMAAAGLTSQVITGLQLVESVVTSPLTWLEVWTGQEYARFDPGTGEIFQKSVSFLPLAYGAEAAVYSSGGETPEVRWTIGRQIISQWRMHFERIVHSSRWLDRWSLFQLPPQFQETFRILILVPVGALIICFLRNIIGFPTFGIFMPVLMALAFRNIGLLYGIAIFAGVVLVGYVVRRWLDRLRLLLVPRLSVLLTLVILAFTVFALVGSRLGMREFMAVGLLPFVILTMTIERFFVLIEESGGKAALRTAAGSAAVATITHAILHFEGLQLTFFVYPELLFTVAAIQILLGRYTGYRLSEVFRFRRLRRSS